ncbi:hypothetical protein EJB05_34703, partial [Eragrostis curvula]
MRSHAKTGDSYLEPRERVRYSRDQFLVLREAKSFSGLHHRRYGGGVAREWQSHARVWREGACGYRERKRRPVARKAGELRPLWNGTGRPHLSMLPAARPIVARALCAAACALIKGDMRLLRDCQSCAHAALSYSPTAQRRKIARAQQLWNEWEIQCLVLVSFSLQVFLLFAAGFRKRCRSRVLSGLLWLSYLSADSVAIYVLGRLTLHSGDPRHQLVIFWAPFLLLHLGGQETIAAFSMDDCALWKRHLLNLATQSTLAVYVVGKQWRGDKRLLAPMLIMFVCGVGKYAERAWDLRRAGSRAPGSRSIAGHVTGARREFEREVFWYYDRLNHILSEKLQLHFELLMEVATQGFQLSFDFLMDVIPAKSLRPETDWNEGLVAMIKSSENRDDLVYRLAEVQLSLIYDYLYTKFGGYLGVLHRPITLVLTSMALSFFLVVLVGQKGTPTSSYSATDVIISYILFIGAVALEISSIFMWFMSSPLAIHDNFITTASGSSPQSFPDNVAYHC